MTLLTIVRIALLGGMVATGVLLYPDGETQSPGPGEITSLLPSPVTVTPLSGPSS